MSPSALLPGAPAGRICASGLYCSNLDFHFSFQWHGESAAAGGEMSPALGDILSWPQETSPGGLGGLVDCKLNYIIYST